MFECFFGRTLGVEQGWSGCPCCWVIGLEGCVGWIRLDKTSLGVRALASGWTFEDDLSSFRLWSKRSCLLNSWKSKSVWPRWPNQWPSDHDSAALLAVPAEDAAKTDSNATAVPSPLAARPLPPPGQPWIAWFLLLFVLSSIHFASLSAHPVAAVHLYVPAFLVALWFSWTSPAAYYLSVLTFELSYVRRIANLGRLRSDNTAKVSSLSAQRRRCYPERSHRLRLASGSWLCPGAVPSCQFRSQPCCRYSILLWSLPRPLSSARSLVRTFDLESLAAY